jgi:hypothetical protein
MMRTSHHLLICLVGFTTACIDHSNRGLPDAAVEYDADTTDADLSVVCSASTTFAGNVNGTGKIELRASGDSTATITITMTAENPKMRGVRIMTGTSCDAGSEGSVWDLGNLGDIDIEAPQPHVGAGELVVNRSDWTCGDGADTDFVGRPVVIYNGAGDTGSIDVCGVLTKD